MVADAYIEIVWQWPEVPVVAKMRRLSHQISKNSLSFEYQSIKHRIHDIHQHLGTEITVRSWLATKYIYVAIT